MDTRTPHDLAIFVYGRLNDDKNRPSVEILDVLFQTIFLASLRTEEGTPVICTVTYVNPKKADPKPPKRIRDPRWRYYPLVTSEEYLISQLAKIAMATDTASSCLVVYPDQKGNLKIWGLFDQQGGFQAILNHESESGWAPPGILQVQILGLGHIIVTSGATVIAELNGGTLVENSVNVFEKSIIFKKLSVGFDRRYAQIEARIKEQCFKLDKDYKSHSKEIWISTIRRILLRARAFGHGGAFLVTDSDYSDHLKIKHGIRYDRLPTLFENRMTYQYFNEKYKERFYDKLDKNQTHIDATHHMDIAISDDETDDAIEAISGAVSFVAALSRIDGLVLLDTNLIVNGFGCEILSHGNENYTLCQAFTPNPTKGKMNRLDPVKFGTCIGSA